MIQVKSKICKGTGKAIGYGCGDKKLLHRYGLCPNCFKEWLFGNDGLPYLNSMQIKAKKQVKADQSKVKIEKSIELMSCDEYRSKYVQKTINEIARLIDYGQPCIATGKYNGKMNGGHYHAVGSNRTLALNLHNIHIQSFESNHFKSGDNLLYKEGLIKTYGLDYFERIEALKQIKPIKLTKSELIEIKKIAGGIRNNLKNNLETYPPKERINIRDLINQQLGIYESIY